MFIVGTSSSRSGGGSGSAVYGSTKINYNRS